MMDKLELLNVRKQELLTAKNEMTLFLESVPVHLERLMKAALPLRKQMALPSTVTLPDPKASCYCYSSSGFCSISAFLDG
jgi:hypothetical protein